MSSKRAAEDGDMWERRRRSRSDALSHRNYAVFAAPGMETFAQRLETLEKSRFQYLPIEWSKFQDGTDKIKMSGFNPLNKIAGEHCIFLASFHSNDVTLSQFSVLIVLLQSFVESLTIVLPYFPVGTMERVDHEGTVATANTYGILLSNLPLAGKPSRLMIYDIHTLQNRFYFHGAVTPSLHSSIPLLMQRLEDFPHIKSVAFPDEGAAKRFSHIFKAAGYSAIICGKVRLGDKRIVTIHDGAEDAAGHAVCIVDDLVQTGGTLFKAAQALKEAGATNVFAFVAHAVFPNDAWKAFCRDGDCHCFEKFWVTNSTVAAARLPDNDVFETLDLLPQIVSDLDGYYV